MALLLLLALIALTGLVLLAIARPPAMGIALAVHLGFILALFLVLPYCKMVHGVYRSRRCCGRRWNGRRGDDPDRCSGSRCAKSAGTFA